MNSQELDIFFSRYNDPDLTDPERTRLEQALADDPVLDGILRQYQRLDRALEQLPDGLDDVDFSDFSRRISNAVMEAEVPSTIKFPLWRRLAPWAAAAALIIAALPLFLFMNPTAPTPTITPSGNEFQAVVELAPTQTLFGQTVVREVGYIIVPDTDENPIMSEEAAGGVICYTQTLPVSGVRSRNFPNTVFFGILPDGSP